MEGIDGGGQKGRQHQKNYFSLDQKIIVTLKSMFTYNQCKFTDIVLTNGNDNPLQSPEVMIKN